HLLVPGCLVSTVQPLSWNLHSFPTRRSSDLLTGNIHFPFEELGFAFFGIALPTWFYEGDAVLTETLYSNGGRGRIPSWTINLRADRKSTRLNSSHVKISYAVSCLKKKR